MSHTAPVTKAPFPRTGIFAALRGVLGGFQGSGARSSGALSSGRGRGRTSSLRLAGLATVLATAFLALTASSALAARGHEFTGTFGTPCTVALEPCGSGLLKEPSAVAVNEATGNIYVLDQGNDRVQEFDSAGNFILTFGGKVNKTAVETPGREAEENLCVAGTGDVCQPGSAGPNPGEFSYPSEPQVSALAVDNACKLQGLSGTECETADPSAEDVYVIDRGHEVIDKFGPSGVYLGQITEYENEAHESKPLFEPEGIAVATDGSVWVLQEGSSIIGELAHYSNGSGNAFEARLALPDAASGGFIAPGFAVDGEGAFYQRRNLTGGHFEVGKRTPSGLIAIEHVGNLLDASGLAVDQRLGNSFIDSATHITAFTPAGEQIEVLGEEGGAHHLTAGAGLAASAAAETIYTADAGAGVVVELGPKQPEAPQILAESASEVSSDSATLGGEINPSSNPGEGATAYRFLYGPCAGGLAGCATSSFPLESATGQIPADFEAHAVAVPIAGLQPHTAYHFLLIAENEQDETEGAERTFTTQGPSSLALPDERGYELVSPPEKFGSAIEPIAEFGIVQAASSGNALTYSANAPIEPHPQGNDNSAQILSTRGVGGWSSENLTVPHGGTTGASAGPGKEYRLFSEDLSSAFVQPFGAFTPSVSPEASEQTPFLRADYLNGDPATPCDPKSMDCFRPLVTGKEPFANVPAGTVFGQTSVEGFSCPSNATNTCGPEVDAATPDGRFAVLRSGVALTAAPISGPALYEWSADAPPASQLQLISLLPSSSNPAPNPAFGYSRTLVHSERGAISADGSRVVFSSEVQTSARRLFLRDTARGETVQLDAGEGCSECESGGAIFQFASADGSRVLFTDTRRLTADSGAEPTGLGKSDLYECRIAEVAGQLRCDLADLTPETGREAADVLGFVPAASTDGSSVYFVANGALTSAPGPQGELAQPGDCSSSNLPGHTCNLYLRRAGQTRLVAVLAGEDVHDWFQPAENPARISPDGDWFTFLSQRSPTGFDNRDRETGRPAAELYLYDAAHERLLCASCNPTGSRPSAAVYSSLERAGGLNNKRAWSGSLLVAATVPGWLGNADSGLAASHQPRYLSDSGRLFFNSGDALAPQDSNGTQDVYQYEPPGVGSCTTADPTYSEQDEGCVSLISSGASAQESAFFDASESGNDVFFLTNSRLTGKDIDSAGDVYDASVGGGEPQLVKPVECTGDACQQPATPPNDTTPGSLTFQGAGNLLECPKGKVKRSGRCVAKRHRKHHRAKHKKKAPKRSAKSKRGNAK